MICFASIKYKNSLHDLERRIFFIFLVKSIFNLIMGAF